MAKSIQLQNIRAWHEELLEFILAHPRASLQETAFYFNVSESWISIVKNSDAFQELWATRRNEHFSRVSATVTERVTALAEISIDALTHKVEQEVNSGNANLQTLKEVGELALKSLGFGVQRNAGGGGNVINNNVILADKEALREAREKMALLRNNRNSQQSVQSIEHSESKNESNHSGGNNSDERSIEGEILYPSKILR